MPTSAIFFEMPGDIFAAFMLAVTLAVAFAFTIATALAFTIAYDAQANLA